MLRFQSTSIISERWLRVKKSVIAANILAFALFCANVEAGPTYSFIHIVESGDGPTQLADGAIGEGQLFLASVRLESIGWSDRLYLYKHRS